MADIRIETRAIEICELMGVRLNPVQIHPNAMPNGFFTDEVLMTTHEWGGLRRFVGLINYERVEISSRETFSRIKMNELWNQDGSKVGCPRFSATVVHELGHYLFGFFDEYLNGNEDRWEWPERQRPTSERYFGLMDNQHAVIRLSRQRLHYNYDGAFSDDPRRNTLHSWVYRQSTEQTLADLLRYLRTSHVRKNEDTVYAAPNWQFAHSDYVISYSLDPLVDGSPRTATYPFAALSDDDFTIIRTNNSRLLNASNVELFENTFDSLASMQFTQSGNVVGVEITTYHDTVYSLYVQRSSDPTPIAIRLDDNDGTYTANFNVSSGEIVILFLRAEVDGYRLQNEFFIDHMQSDVGYVYQSIDSRVAGYAISDTPITTLYIAENASFENGEYFSVSQATHLITTSSGEVRGEIYAEADAMANIDKTSLSWFVRKNGVWIQLPTDLSDVPENISIGARADYIGDGLYVLMARSASEDTLEQIQNVSYQQSTERDAVVFLTFDDPNPAEVVHNYEVRFSYEQTNDWDDINIEREVYLTTIGGGESMILPLNLWEPGRVVYLVVIARGANGARSQPSEPIRVVSGTVQRNNVRDTFELTAFAEPGGNITDVGGQYAQGREINISAIPDSGYMFTGWSATAGEFESTSSTTTVFTMPASSATITAHFELISEDHEVFILEITAEAGGTIIRGESGQYILGAQINISATPDEGYFFSGWIATAGTFDDASSADTVFTMPGSNVSITARFENSAEASSGVAVSGLISSFNPGFETKIQLLESNMVKYEKVISRATGDGQIEQRFMFNDVEPGTYTLIVEKTSHTSFMLRDIVISEENIDLTQSDREEIRMITLTPGDINGDGQIDSRDLSILMSNFGLVVENRLRRWPG